MISEGDKVEAKKAVASTRCCRCGLRLRTLLWHAAALTPLRLDGLDGLRGLLLALRLVARRGGGMRPLLLRLLRLLQLLCCSKGGTAALRCGQRMVTARPTVVAPNSQYVATREGSPLPLLLRYVAVCSRHKQSVACRAHALRGSSWDMCLGVPRGLVDSKE